MSSVLELRGVGQRFGGLQALSEVTFTLRQGGITGLIGPNGAGKSTLFAAIAGAINPTTGRILYRDRDVTGWKPHQAAAAGVARTFQLMRVFGSMTVLDNCVVAAHLRRRGRRGARELAEHALELTGLASLARTPAAGLTAPSKKRLEVARALATDPALLLLDEVLSGLTPAEGQRAVQMLRDISRTGLTIVMVEHVMEVIMPLCDHLVVLNHGQLIAQGAPGEIAHDQAVIEAYLGQP